MEMRLLSFTGWYGALVGYVAGTYYVALLFLISDGPDRELLYFPILLPGYLALAMLMINSGSPLTVTPLDYFLWLCTCVTAVVGMWGVLRQITRRQWPTWSLVVLAISTGIYFWLDR